MEIALILCIMVAIGCLVFAGSIWHKRKKLDIEIERQNALLLQEQEGIHRRNSELLQNQAKILQESVQLEKTIQIKQITENELNDAIEKLKDSRHQQIVVFEREQAKLEVINRQQDDAAIRLKETEESIVQKQLDADKVAQERRKQQDEEWARKQESIAQQTKAAAERLNELNLAIAAKQEAEKEILRNAFEQYADNLELEEQNLEREYEELEQKLQSVYAEQQDLLAASKEDIIKEHEALTKRLTEVYAALQTDLEKDLDATRAELDKIRATKAAALEAQLREQQIKENATYYTLQISEADKTDISYLRSIEHNLREPRPLRMLIWSTFYRDRANDLANRAGAVGACGIYKITHIDSGLSYIGQARNIKDRWIEHIKCSLGIDTPVTSQLYAFTREKGIENFTFEVLEVCAAADLNEKERTYIDMYQTKDFGLNKTKGNK